MASEFNGSDRKLQGAIERAASSALLAVVSRITGPALAALVLAATGFFGPKVWDWAVEQARLQSEQAQALQRVTLQLEYMRGGDTRQDRTLENHEGRIQSLEQARAADEARREAERRRLQ